MTLKNIYFVVDKTKKTQLLKKFLYKKYNKYKIHESDIIVVIGGDGFMLETLKKYQKYLKPFYGMNRGTFGFLMNKFKKNNLHNYISKAKQVEISPLYMTAYTKNRTKKSAVAINEVSLLRQSRQTAYLQINSKKKVLIKKLICDGVLVSSPAGSTAYNLSVHGPILSLNSKKLAITPISPFRPRRWKGKIVPSSSVITVRNLSIKKRPVSVVADNFEVRNVKSVNICVSKVIKFKLLYDKGSNLNQKIKLEQLKTNGL